MPPSLAFLVLLLVMIVGCGSAPVDAPADARAGDAPMVDAGGLEVSAPVDAPADAPVDQSLPLDAPEPADASAAPDVREVGADVASPPDAAPDGPVDAPGDAPADAGDPLLDQVTAVRVTATVDGMVWTPDPSPRCEVNSGELSLTAGFSRGSIGARGSVPSMMGVGATAVLTLNERGAAEVDAPRATLTRGPYYGAGGERRMNLRLRGMPGGVGGPLVDVIALGCVVR